MATLKDERRLQKLVREFIERHPVVELFDLIDQIIYTKALEDVINSKEGIEKEARLN